MKITSLSKRSYNILRNEGPQELVSSAKFYLGTVVDIPSAYARQLRYRLKYGQCAPPPYQVVQIDPDQITHMLGPRFEYDHSSRGTYIKDGEWDSNYADIEFATRGELRQKVHEQTLVSFDNFGLHRAMTEHLKNGIPWEETGYYEQRRNRGVSKATLETKRKKVQGQFEDIKRLGYRRQRDLPEMKKLQGPPEIDELKVNITRRGEFVLDDGIHRLSIAKILGCESIPVRVYVRHSGWQTIRQEICDVTQDSDLSEHARSFVEHPDVQDVRD